MFKWLRRRPRPSGWHLVDLRPSREANPYTFFLPSAEAIASLEPGDLIRLFFEPEDEDGRVERMWVIFEGRDSDGGYGRLDNEPLDIPGLHAGDRVHFQDYHIATIDVPRVSDPEADAWEDRMFTRTRVAREVLDGTARIGRIERHQRQDVEGISFPDSGFWLYAEGLPEPAAEALSFVAIGVVLGRDNSLLPYLDAPEGTVLTRADDGSFQTA